MILYIAAEVENWDLWTRFEWFAMVYIMFTNTEVV